MFKTVLINSQDRAQGTESAFRVDFENKDLVINRYKVRSIVIPKTYPNVNAYNKTFVLNYNSVDYTITLSQGIYTVITDLTGEMVTKMNTAVGGTPLSASYSSITGKVTFTSSTSNFFFKFASSGEIASLIGFEETDGIAAATQVSTKRVNLEYSPVIYLHINELKPEGLSSSNAVGSYQKAILSIRYLYGQSIAEDYLEDDLLQCNYHYKAINALNIRLVDYKNRTINMDETNWSVELEIE